MWDMDSSVLNAAFTMVVVALLALAGCGPQRVTEPPVDVPLYQSWELQPGDAIAGHQVLGGLGDISIALDGNTVYAPYEGRVQPYQGGCVMFSSTDVPNYLLRLCGLNAPKYGPKETGEALGRGDVLQFAVLNKRPDGKWALVEPSKQILEQMLQAR